MIITEHKVETQGNIKFDEDVAMGFDASAHAFLVNNLIKQYADPYLAALREYTSNARDAHRASGQTRPVEVALPTPLSPNLIIEDFGIGLTREELKGFGQFGKSSKRDSNEYVGGFGLGSKSGLAVSSQFSVTSVKDGKRNTVIVRRDESGAPSMGFLAEQAVPGEQSGTRITIPTTERERFARAVEKGFFYGWEPGTILIDGEEPEFTVHDDEHFTPIGEAGWRRVKDQYTSHSSIVKALVGPVAYDLDMYKVAGDGIEVDWYNKYHYLSNLVVKLDNGSVEIHPSRETLIYDKRTRTAIAERLNALIDAGHDEHQKAIDAAKTARQAVLAMIRAEKEGFAGSYTYKGVSLDFKSTKRDNEKVWDQRIWRGKVSRSTRANSGYGIDRRYSTYGSLVGSVGSVQSLYQNESILVWGIEEPTNSDYLPKELSGAVVWAGVDAKKADTSILKYELVFTMGKPSDFDKFFMNAFSKVVNVNDYAAVVKAERTRIAAETRAANRANGLHSDTPRKPSIKKDEVRVLRYRAGGRSVVLHTPVDELDPQKVHFLIKNGESRLMTSLRSTLMTQVNRNGSLDTLIDMLDKTGRYTFVVANANTNTEKYPELLPNFTNDLQEVIVAESKLALSGFTEFDKFLSAKGGRLNGFFAQEEYSEDQIDSIEDPALAEFLTNMAGYRTRVRAAQPILNAIRNGAYYLDLGHRNDLWTLPAPKSIISIPDFEQKYPMLKKYGYSYPDFPESVVIDYVNTIHRVSESEDN